MREAVRSGRRDPFYTIENSFIDHYAREIKPNDIAVYNVLVRFMNNGTRSTWVSTAKIASLINLSQRTVQRRLKILADHKLIRIFKTKTQTTYVIPPVPPRPKTANAPLFDRIPDEEILKDIEQSEGATPLPFVATPLSPATTSVSQVATFMSQISDTSDTVYKEEQNLLNKTQEQDFLNKAFETSPYEIQEGAKRLIAIFGLQNTLIHAVMAAVELEFRKTGSSIDEVVQEIWKKVTRADRRGISREKFFDDYLTEVLAEHLLDGINLPLINNLILTVMATLKAEAKDTGLGLEQAAAKIATAATQDRRKGIPIDRFYFENMKWRNGNAGHRPSASQQRSERTKQNILDGLTAEISRRNQPHGAEQ